ncbi:ORC-CDC6 family AAA ATPase [Parapedobacter sp. 10938]|uniref:ORC-CDC6 family AAA ATPase n=1 Tax=Parapedobacter flavus TaxID=3110225 RepID=UPI002DB9A7C8|nr:hypothetical protein [Parapedobacter sp. 10938]MEC3881919.1 hypothetical protein [Parapedobacter sp. 10938]
MENRRNPFHEIYLTESIGSESFVRLFSPYLVDKTLALFEPGHVILKGLPGTGKSMLLSLLKPSIRKAYARNNIDFPVPENLNKFIGAGINLRRSGVSDFGQRPVDKAKGFEESPYYFADYLNYWIVLDILESIEELGEETALAEQIGIDVNEKNLHVFSEALSSDPCWNGYLSEIKSYRELKARLDQRIRFYRNFLNYNSDAIPEEIKSTKTVIGFPMTVLAKTLRESNVISDKTEIFVRIDQYEELAWLEDIPNHPEKVYQQMVHKLLAMRDTSVSYRLGTRHFAWDVRGNIFGTSARLEKGRNYIDISIDSLLKRKENRRTWVFPDFAEDILQRRINLSGLKYSDSQKKGVLALAFGRSGKPSAKARLYIKSDKKKAIKVEKDWPAPWNEFLNNLAEEDPFNARLAEAWVRQKGKQKQSVMYNIPLSKPYPWEKQWWKKERSEQALIQIASRNNQQLMWFGKEDILSLCGSNILAFLQLCRSIWDVWIRDTYNIEQTDSLPQFDSEIQSVGVIETSNAWYENISLEKGGRDRKTFINFLGSLFYKTLVEDLAMSNPGHYGFSLDIEELEKDAELRKFLNEATDYGDLYDAPHTSKLKDKRERIKWYLNPILSPRFKLPSVHTKEPIYTSVNTVKKWRRSCLEEENGLLSTKAKRSKKTGGSDDGQISLNF